jgi:hypothetical protein
VWLLRPTLGVVVHSLRRKQADTNEELLKPGANEDPRADKTYVNPWAGKGTEPRTASTPRRARRRTADVNGISADYPAALEAALKALDHLYKVAPEGGDISECAMMTASDMRYWRDEQVTTQHAPTTPKRAEIKMHTSPKVLPPRMGVRTYLDQDIKKEMKAENEGETVPKHALRRSGGARV